jgi:hypothetical protein
VIIALLSDIHGNLEALTACLKHAGESTVARHAAEAKVVVKENHDDIDKTRAT